MYRQERSTNDNARKSLSVSDSSGMVGLKGGAHDEISGRIVRNGSFAFQRALRASGPRFGG